MSIPAVTLQRGRRGTDASSAWVRSLRLRLFKDDGKKQLVNTGIPAKDAKHVLLALSQYVDHNGTCFPSFQTLSDDTEMSWDSIKRRLADLEYLRLIARFRRWRDTNGVINEDGRGRETSGEIRFLFDTTQDDIDALLRAKADNGDPPEKDDSDDATTELGCADSAPQIAPAEAELGCANSAPGVRTAAHPIMNPSLEPCSPQNPPSQAEARQEAADQSEPDRLPFHRFATSYPIPILKPAEAQTIWSAMTDDERSQAIEGARGYARFLEREKRRAMDAHKWLRQRLWTQFASTPDLAERRFVPEDAEGFAAWEIGYQLRGYRELPYYLRTTVEGRRGAYFPTEFPPLGRGLPKFDRATWTFIPRGDRRWWAWHERLVGAFGEGVKFITKGKADGVECEGAWFPSDWPPPKHGSSSSTGPPSHLTEDDMAVLEKMR